MSWYEKLLPTGILRMGKPNKSVREGIWSLCDNCQASLYCSEVEKSLYVCPKCSHHMRINAEQRLRLFLDVENWEALAEDVIAVDRLKFKDIKKYKDRISAAVKKTGNKEALLVRYGLLKHIPVVAIAFDFNFIGGSMSAGVGERFVQGVQAAIKRKCPVVCFSASGGARMQEGLFSLMQMAKTSAILAELSQANLPYISVLTDPTMGGVSASLAMLGDIIIAEPKALIGFAGPRVIEQTVKETLPEGFQRSEFLLEHGAIDQVVDRREMRDTIARLLAKLMHLQAP